MEKAEEYMKKAIFKSYGKKGEKVIQMNYAAVEKGLELVKEAEVPARWADLSIEAEKEDPALPGWIKNIQMPVNSMKGDRIPVSAFLDAPDGTCLLYTSRCV